MSKGIAPPWLHGAETQQVAKCVLGVASPPLRSGGAPGDPRSSCASSYVGARPASRRRGRQTVSVEFCLRNVERRTLCRVRPLLLAIPRALRCARADSGRAPVRDGKLYSKPTGQRVVVE